MLPQLCGRQSRAHIGGWKTTTAAASSTAEAKQRRELRILASELREEILLAELRQKAETSAAASHSVGALRLLLQQELFLEGGSLVR